MCLTRGRLVPDETGMSIVFCWGLSEGVSSGTSITKDDYEEEILLKITSNPPDKHVYKVTFTPPTLGIYFANPVWKLLAVAQGGRIYHNRIPIALSPFRVRISAVAFAQKLKLVVERVLTVTARGKVWSKDAPKINGGDKVEITVKGGPNKQPVPHFAIVRRNLRCYFCA